MTRRPRARTMWFFAISLAISLTIAAQAVTAHAGPLDGWSSSNVAFVRNISLPGAGGLVRDGKHLFVLHANGLAIFDVSRPEEPEQISGLFLPQALAPVDPTTNGRILLASQAPSPDGGTDLSIIDVEDRTNPHVRATLPGAGDHNMTCILDCTWAYGGAFGYIVDLRDPRNPVLQEERWSDGLEFPGGLYGSFHDVTEVRPGIVLTASVPMYLLDVRKNPRRPRVLARSDGSPFSYGGVIWPRGGRDRIVMSFAEPGTPAASCRMGETFSGTTMNTGFKTWDASHWRKTRLFKGLDEYIPADGMYTDGSPPASFFPFFGGCQAAWFDPHPSFRNGGLVAEAFAGYGIRFLEVSRGGDIKEVGFWLGLGGSAAFATRWITDDIVYATHFDRGIDILRFTKD